MSIHHNFVSIDHSGSIVTTIIIIGFNSPLAEKQGRPFPGFESHPLNIGDWKCNSIFENHPVSCVEEWTLELKKVIGSHPMDSVHATKGRLGQQISANFRKCSKLSWPPPPLENWAPKSEMKCLWTGNAPPFETFPKYRGNLLSVGQVKDLRLWTRFEILLRESPCPSVRDEISTASYMYEWLAALGSPVAGVRGRGAGGRPRSRGPTGP